MTAPGPEAMPDRSTIEIPRLFHYLKVFGGIQFVLVLAGTAAIRCLSTGQAWAFLVGGLFIQMNLLLLGLVCWLFLVKKAVALGVLSVVFKYAFLGVSIYLVIIRFHAPMGAFGAGIGSLVGAAVLFSIYYVTRER